MEANRLEWLYGAVGYIVLVLLFASVFLTRGPFFQLFIDEFVALPLLSLVMVGVVIARLWRSPELSRGVWLFHGISIVAYALVIHSATNFKLRDLEKWRERLAPSEVEWALGLEMLMELVSSLAFIASVGVAAVGSGVITIALSGERWRT